MPLVVKVTIVECAGVTLYAPVIIMTSAPDTQRDTYADLARQLRADSIRSSSAAGSGHPSSSLSAADLLAVLLGGHLRYD